MISAVAPGDVQFQTLTGRPAMSLVVCQPSDVTHALQTHIHTYAHGAPVLLYIHPRIKLLCGIDAVDKVRPLPTPHAPPPPPSRDEQHTNKLSTWSDDETFFFSRFLFFAL